MRSLSSCCWFGMNYTWSKTPCWWTSRTSPGDEAHNEDLHHSKFINYVTGRKSQVCSFSQNKHQIYHLRVFFSVKFFEKALTCQLTFHCKQTLCSFKKKKGGRYWKFMLLLTLIYPLSLNIFCFTRPSLLLQKFHSSCQRCASLLMWPKEGSLATKIFLRSCHVSSSWTRTWSNLWDCSRHLLEQWFPIVVARHTCCPSRPGLEIP